MELLDAKLRLKELTQEMYNIGDEVAEYIEHIAEAITDWDAELVEECLLEFDEIAVEAINDARVVASELYGIRQALISGLRAGAMGVWESSKRTERYARPQLVDAHLLSTSFALSSPMSVPALSDAMQGRTELATQQLAAIVEWELDQTACAAADLESVSLATMFTRTRRLVHACAEGWLETVARAHPSYAAAARGSHPPEFLAERAWIDGVVASVRRRMHASDRGA